MDKILLEIYVPAASKTYDVFIPLKSKLYEVLQLLGKVSLELSDGRLCADKTSVLCFRMTGNILDLNKTVEEHNLNNGAQLMII